jgi:hypothetical protein
MLKIVLLVLFFVIACGSLTGFYLLIRHYHRKWAWQDRVNANTISQAALDDATCEVTPDGQVLHTGRLDAARASQRAARVSGRGGAGE